MEEIKKIYYFREKGIPVHEMTDLHKLHLDAECQLRSDDTKFSIMY